MRTRGARRPGLLIVNADDWGGEGPRTDAILRCFAIGAVTSTSAMVFMEDSVRAAALARDHRLPAGLHLNLTQAFSGRDVPVHVRARQERLLGFFARQRLRRFTYDPRVRAAVAAAVEDQLQAFVELYGKEPTHLDGHEHVHLGPDVLLSPGVRSVRRVRTWRTARPGESGAPARARQVRAALLARGHVTTDAFFSVRTLAPELGGHGLSEAIALSHARPVEIMVHPGWSDEDALLASPSWPDLLSDAPTGSYAELVA